LVSKTWAQALVYCLAFGLGTVISPLLVLAVLSGLIPRFLLKQKEAYYKVVAFICGLIMVFLGINLILFARH
ncbi:MAG: hypothetical protein PHF11_00175, partial [Candidatus Omnitrophica bacterium]|nr:hypothetical protein [Candidatus Omnitrophota bacterium]